MSKDTLTTVLGGILAVGQAAEPVVSAVDGTFGSSDWIKLAVAIVTAIFGWFTNKP